MGRVESWRHTTLRRSKHVSACTALCPPFHRRSSRAVDFLEEQLDREVPEDHADGRLGGALERVLAHVEQGDATALEACADGKGGKDGERWRWRWRW
eukprot:scaffold60049_cov50-Phaeocystis_antarctica.AAC.1